VLWFCEARGHYEEFNAGAAMFRIMHNLCQWCALGVRGRNWVGEGREAWFWGVMAPRIELWITGTSFTQGQELWVDAMATQGDSLRFSLYNNGNRPANKSQGLF